MKGPKDIGELNAGVRDDQRRRHLEENTCTIPVPPSPEVLNAARQSYPSKSGRRLTLRSPLEILAMEFSDDDLILLNGYLAFTERLAVCGMGGVGKSRLLMQLAISVRLGWDFIGWKTNGQKLKWLFLQTENSNRRLRHDLERMFATLTTEERQHVSEGLRFHTLETETDGIVFLNQPEARLAVEQAIAESGADIVILDPLRDSTTGDINQDVDMAEALSLFSAAVRKGNPRRVPVVLHHAGTGKAGVLKATGYDRSSFARNSKVLHGWSRAMINIVPAGENDNNKLVIASGKCSNAVEFKPFAITLNPTSMFYEVDTDFDVETWQIGLNTSPAKRAKSTPKNEALLELVPATHAIGKATLQQAAQKAGIAEKDFRTMLEAMLEAETLYEWQIPRKRVRPEIRIARFKQPNGEKEPPDLNASQC